MSISISNLTLYAHGGSGNHGCEAIVRSTVKILKSTKLSVYLYSKKTKEDKKYNLEKIVANIYATEPIKRFSIKHFLSAISFKLLKNTNAYTKYQFINLFRIADTNTIAISIGGDNYCYDKHGRELYGYLNGALVENGISTVLFGCSIEPESLSEISLIDDLNKYSLITPRESITYNALISAGITRNTHLFPDPAFTLDEVNLWLPEGFIEKKTIGLNVSPLIQSMELGDNITYKNYQALVQHIIDKTDFQVAFIPHVVWENNNDLVPLAQLYNEFKHTGRVVLIGDHNCMELKGFISRCRMFIGARTHASIAAYSTCVPTLVVGYSVKAKGIARDIFGTYENYVLPVQSLKSADELTNAFKWLMQNEEGIRSHLQAFMPGYIERAWQAGDEVMKLIEAKD